jgi:hypothetical protein
VFTATVSVVNYFSVVVVFLNCSHSRFSPIFSDLFYIHDSHTYTPLPSFEKRFLRNVAFFLSGTMFYYYYSYYYYYYYYYFYKINY